jgi:hypothetical protein
MERPLITHFDSPTSLRAGLLCRCPRCGEGKLFAGFLRLAKRCDRCGLDYGFADPADGPAFFVMTGVGILVIAVWAWAVIAWSPAALGAVRDRLSSLAGWLSRHAAAREGLAGRRTVHPQRQRGRRLQRSEAVGEGAVAASRSQDCKRA